MPIRAPTGVLTTITRTLVEPSNPLTDGTLFAGRFRISSEIGRGGMGIVYKADDMRLKRPVALKFLPPELERYPKAKERFVREAQAAAVLDHPNICTVYEADEAAGKAYIVMAYIKGRNLREMTSRQPLRAEQAVDIARQVADGLAAAHKQGIIHRDIKSGNIMVTEAGQVKIMDFGLAKLTGEALITSEARTMGTAAYMSPEQARGEVVDHRTDLWSMGVVLYEMLSGELPFSGDRESTILHSILNREPTPLRRIKPDIPARLAQVIEKSLKKDRGAWGEPTYMFFATESYSPWLRFPTFGFRCMKTVDGSPVFKGTLASLRHLPPMAGPYPEPCSEEVFQAYLRIYQYPKKELHSRIESKKELTRNTDLEKVSFDAAYPGERMTAYLFLPRGRKGPFQPVIHHPGGGAWYAKKLSDYMSEELFAEIMTKTDRALILPVFRGTFERQIPEKIKKTTTPYDERIMIIKDSMRIIDYLESRPELDTGKLVYEGLSAGAGWVSILPAIDARIKAVILIGGGRVRPGRTPEMAIQNLVPRVRVPVLMLNGRYDFAYPVESNQIPLLKLFGTPDNDKHHRLFESGHAVWMKNEAMVEEVNFLDKYFGPVQSGREPTSR